MESVEWSDELKKAARSLAYFSIFAAAAGFLDIDAGSAFFGVKINNFNQFILYIFLILASSYWFSVVVFRITEEWYKLSRESASLYELAVENKSHINQVLSDIKYLKDKTNVDVLIKKVKEYDDLNEKAAPKTASSSAPLNFNYRIRQQAIYEFVQDAGNVTERILVGLGQTRELVNKNRRLIRLRGAALVRFAFLEVGVPFILFLFALSAILFGSH